MRPIFLPHREAVSADGQDGRSENHRQRSRRVRVTGLAGRPVSIGILARYRLPGGGALCRSLSATRGLFGLCAPGGGLAPFGRGLWGLVDLGSGLFAPRCSRFRRVAWLRRDLAGLWTRLRLRLLAGRGGRRRLTEIDPLRAVRIDVRNGFERLPAIGNRVAPNGAVLRRCAWFCEGVVRPFAFQSVTAGVDGSPSSCSRAAVVDGIKYASAFTWSSVMASENEVICGLSTVTDKLVRVRLLPSRLTAGFVVSGAVVATAPAD